MSVRTLDSVELAGKRVLVRVDLNLPMHDGRITDPTRLTAAAQTVREIAAKGGRVVVLAHFGRPKGVDKTQSLEPLLAPLAAALAPHTVRFVADCIGPAAEAAVAGLGAGEVLLCENLRFHAGEEANDSAFVAALATLGDLWVMDAFSAAHRAHASTAGLGSVLPGVAGRTMQRELAALGKALAHPDRPVMAIVGGAKVSTKLDLLGNLAAKVDILAIGGGMANTFLAALGLNVQDSLCEHALADTARAIQAEARKRGCKILLPIDVVVAEQLSSDAEAELVAVERVPAGRKIFDIGPATVAGWLSAMRTARTVVWNGPVGAFEVPPFDQGTIHLARKLAELDEMLSVAGGGDTVAALAAAGVIDKMSYVSTAGGAFLEWLEGKTLPGVAAVGG
jgi:phosphoglycerate kinase